MSNARGVAGTRVLVAEDEVFCAMELEEMLKALECNVVAVVSKTDKILDSAAEADCALLDINLKGESSYSAALALKERGVAVVFVTGYSQLRECPKGLAQIPQLVKPFTKEKLQNVLGGVLERAA